MQVLIVGDSHTGALERGRKQAAMAGLLPEDVHWRIRPLGSGRRMSARFWREEGGKAVLTDPEYARHMPVLPPDDPRPDVIGLSMPLWSGRVLRGLLEGGHRLVDTDGPGRLISRALFTRLVREDAAPAMDLARFLQGQGLPVFVIEPPRVFASHVHLTRYPAARVLGLQTAIRTLQRADIVAAGMEIVSVPAECLDDQGFMRAEHSSEDPLDNAHANAAFGLRMLHESLPLIRRLAEERASAP